MTHGLWARGLALVALLLGAGLLVLSQTGLEALAHLKLVIATALRHEAPATSSAKWHARVKEEALAAIPKPPEKKP